MSNTSTHGIFQSDIVLRTAILTAMKDIRENPWLLEYAFMGLKQDTLTAPDYGEKQVQEAKRWFMKTDIPVFHALMTEPPKIPSITITMVNSQETDVTLGDTHHDPSEDLDDDPPVLPSFVPKGYDWVTGTMTLPDSVADSVVVVPGMRVADTGGKNFYTITDVDPELKTLTLTPGINADFGVATLHYRMPVFKISLESVVEKEDYLIGVHADEPSKLVILYSIVKMLLYRYKESLLESRGMQKVTFSSTDFSKLQIMDPESAFSRYISLSGYVRQYWPKDIKQTIQSTDGGFKVIGADTLPSDTDPNSVLWAGENDVLSGAGT
jgi:hypothetical protein